MAKPAIRVDPAIDGRASPTLSKPDLTELKTSGICSLVIVATSPQKSSLCSRLGIESSKALISVSSSGEFS